ncbi:MAG TPA: L,D-transpeptidase [Candidatus Nanopelagicales bacterium]|nr:L,D-transpeptidase [Candidatus Nanopelagicales bacterium]
MSSPRILPALLLVGAAACAPTSEPPGRSASASPAAPALEPPPPAPAEAEAEVAEVIEPEINLDALRPGQGDRLASIAMRTFVHMEPRRRSTRLGYLRAGTVVERAAAPAAYDGCSRGWYAIHPRGYVCVGKTATLDVDHDITAATPRGPRRGEPYPYLYVISRQPPPHLYVHLPTEAEQRRVEGRTRGQERSTWALRNEQLLGEPDPMTEFFTSGKDLPKPYGAEERLRFPAHRGRAKHDSAFGLIATFDWTGRRFGLTTELDLIPIDRTRAVIPTAMRGVEVKTEGTPAFVMHHGVRTLKPDASGQLAPHGWASYRSGWVLTGKSAVSGVYVETDAGLWLPAEALRIARLGQDLWAHAKRGLKWIDVSIEQQMLVAYEGKRPVFATLVSTGRGELADPETTSATVRGTFFLQSKHLTATMDGDEASENARDLRDVPYVQYFHKGYALHGVYWHDDFGKVKSNGCVNMSPADAGWLFEWTEPVVPEGWHGAIHEKGGTLVYIHP